jgi:hypothetical protein
MGDRIEGLGMAEESSNAGSQRKAGKKVDVGELLKNLKLHDSELDDVFLGKEEMGNLPMVKWMAAAKLLSRKGFSSESLKRTMLVAWNLAQEVTIRDVEPNLFTMQARCLADWKRITEEGPWLFQGCALMTEPFDGATAVPTVVSSRVQVWIQIMRIPPLYRTKEIITQLTSRVGKVMAVELMVVPLADGDFHRVRVSLDSMKPLTRFTPLTPEGQDGMFLQVQFEKIPHHCEHCGLMDHEYMECGTGEFAEEDLQFGAWLKAEEALWRPGTPGMRVPHTFSVHRQAVEEGFEMPMVAGQMQAGTQEQGGQFISGGQRSCRKQHQTHPRIDPRKRLD